jgi:uncharacterized alpha-E superfamily protein
MARYTERAENTARMLDVAYQTSLMPQPNDFMQESWRKLLNVSLLEKQFESKYVDYNRENILQFMIFDDDNPSSIVCCLNAARVNARIIRGKIPSDVCETQNLNWLKLNKFLPECQTQEPSAFFAKSTIYLLIKHFLTLFSILPDKSSSTEIIGSISESKNQLGADLKVLKVPILPIGVGSLFKSTVIIFLYLFCDVV